MNNADFAANVPWVGVQGKPSTFPPSPHTHATTDLERTGGIDGDVLTLVNKRWVPLSPQKAKVIAQANSAIATIEETVEVVANDVQALARKTTELTATFSDSSARLTEKIQAVATKITASAAKQTELDARLGDAEAFIRRLDEVTVTRDTALAKTTEEIGATVGTQSAQITTIRSTYATRSYAEAKSEEAIEVSGSYTDTTASALTTAITTAYTTADSVITASVSTLNGVVVAQGSRVTTLESQVQTPTTGLIARVSTIESTYVTSTSATAIATSVVSASIVSTSGGTIGAAITASTSAEATIRANGEAFLSGKYTLTVVAGNVVTGMNITSSTGGGTSVSDVTFNAASFKIYNGTTGVSAFSVVGGIVTAGTELDVGSGLNRTQITSTGLSLGAGVVTAGGGSGDYIFRFGGNSAIKIETIASGAASAIQMVSRVSGSDVLNGVIGGDGTASFASVSVPAGSMVQTGTGRLGLVAGSTRSIAMVTDAGEVAFFSVDGNFKMNGGDMRKVGLDGWTTPLFDGTYTIEFQATGASAGSPVRIRVNGTDIGAVTPS